MDIVHGGYDVAGLLRPDHPLLTGVCIRGPLRCAKNSFLRACATGIRHLIDLGGGQGGDSNLWIHHVPDWQTLDVLDIDRNALEEYARRLASTHRAQPCPERGHPDTCSAWVLGLPPNGMRIIRLHHGDILRPTNDQVWHGAELAVMDFVVSQVVGCCDDAATLVRTWCVERGVQRLALTAHDHAFAGLPPDDGSTGVRCVALPLGCHNGDIVWRPGQPPLPLETTIAGTTMARGIREFAFDADAFAHTIRAEVARGALPATLRVHLERPYATADMHWLLRSLVFIQIVQ